MLEKDFALLAIRLVVGLLFVGHGAQKLFGWFGGGGLEGTTKFMKKLDIQPPQFWALVTALAEFLGGLGLAFGILTPLAAAAIIGTMLMAIIKVHGKNGLWDKNDGIEYNLVLLIVAAAVGLAGPGAYALDNYLNIAYPMPLTFIVSIVLTILGTLLSLYSSDIRTYFETEYQS